MSFSLSSKFNKEFFLRKKNDIIFITIGVVLLVAVLFVFVSSITFLSGSVDTAIDNQSSQTTVVQFNISALEKLGIVQNSSTTASSSTSARQ